MVDGVVGVTRYAMFAQDDGEQTARPTPKIKCIPHPLQMGQNERDNPLKIGSIVAILLTVVVEVVPLFLLFEVHKMPL